MSLSNPIQSSNHVNEECVGSSGDQFVWMRPVEKVSLNLVTFCGAIPLEDFLANDYDEKMQLDYREIEKESSGKRDRNVFSNTKTDSDPSKNDPTTYDDLAPMDIDDDEDGTDAGSRADRPGPSTEALGKLHKACKRLSGTVEALTFEFIEEHPSAIQCVLTVTAPTPQGPFKRSYSTLPSFSSRSDAKRAAAVIAVDMGVLDFIQSPMISSVCVTKEHPQPSEVEKIDQFCQEWRPGIKPEYITYRHRKGNNEIGCALRIALTPHSIRIYSTGAEYSSIESAKEACAVRAVQDGVCDYIMRGNGQKSKPQVRYVVQPQQPSATAQLSLQEFFDTLPRPFVEPIDATKGASEIPWSNMFNTIIQGGKLSTLKANFYINKVTGGLTGCVLRVSTSTASKELVKTYIVDPHFVRSNDAKTAACMVAITQNLRGYLANISKTYSSLDGELGKMVSEKTLKMISKLRTGNVEYDMFGDSKHFRCSLIVDVSPIQGRTDLRKFTSPTPLASKAEAKIAAVLEAAKQGVVELLRFGAVTSPVAGYQTFWDAISKGEAYDLNVVGKNDGGGSTKAKKRKRKRDGESKKSAKMTGVEPVNNEQQQEEQASEEESGEISDQVSEKASAPTKKAQSLEKAAHSKRSTNKKQKNQHANTMNRTAFPPESTYYHNPSPPLHPSAYPVSPEYPLSYSPQLRTQRPHRSYPHPDPRHLYPIPAYSPHPITPHSYSPLAMRDPRGSCRGNQGSHGTEGRREPSQRNGRYRSHGRYPGPFGRRPPEGPY